MNKTKPFFLLPIALLWLVIPESPRYLLAKGKIDQLKRDIKKTARINKKEYPQGLLDVNLNITDPSAQEGNSEKEIVTKKATFWDLFRPQTILWRTLCLFYIWMVIIF